MRAISENTRAPAAQIAGVCPSLLEALSEGLHSLAQPLTVLRATLEIAAGNACCVSQYQHAIDSSLNEVSRVVDAMGFVQELMRIGCDVSQAERVDVSAAVAMVYEDLRCVVDTASVSVEISVPSDLPGVLASRISLRQCLFYILQQTLDSCSARDSIHIVATSASGEVQIIIRQETSGATIQRRPAECESRLRVRSRSMTLAEILAAVHGGHLLWRSEPFGAQLSFVAEASGLVAPERAAQTTHPLLMEPSRTDQLL